MLEAFNHGLRKAKTQFLLLLGIFLLSILTVGYFVFDYQAQASNPPEIITYQGKLLVSGSAASTTQAMYFLIYDAATNGNALYSASGTVGTPLHVSTTPSNGLFSINLGDTSVPTNELGNIFSNNSNLYLEVRIGATTLSPRKRLTASPYALNSLYLNGVMATSTASSSVYIPISNADGSFNFNTTTVSTSTITYATISSAVITSSTVVSSTITNANITNLNVFGNVTSSGTIYPVSNNLVDLGSYEYSFRNVYVSGTAYIANAILSGHLLSSSDNLYDVGSSSTQWRYGNFQSGVFVADGTSTSTLFNNTFIVGQASNYNLGKFYIDSDGVVSVSSSIRTFGNVTSTGIIYGLGGIISSASSTFSSNVHVSGNLGIGTSSPQQKLHVEGGGVLIDGPKNINRTAGINVFNDYVYKVFVSGQRAYVGTKNAGGTGVLQIYDITSSATTTLLGSVDTGVADYVRSIYVAGKYAYIGGNNFFSIYDISNPLNIRLLSSQAINANDIRVVGKYAYVSGVATINDIRYELLVYDITNPSSPQFVNGSSWGVGSIGYSLDINNQYAFVGVYVSVNNQDLKVVDISNVNNLQTISTYDVGSNYINSIDASGRYIYLGTLDASGVDDFLILEMSTSTNLAKVGGVNVVASEGVFAVMVAGKYAYLGGSDSAHNGNEFQAYDISDTSNPFFAGGVSTGDDINSLFISGKYIYIGTKNDVNNEDFQIYNLGGLDALAATIGDITTNNLTVWDDLSVGGILQIRNGLNVGSGGMQVQGNTAIFTSSTGYNANIFSVSASSTTSNLSIFNILDNGNVGIGTATPSEKLTVSGGNLAVTNNSATSTLGANFFSVASSTSAMSGIFYVNSSGLISASSSIFTFGNVTSTGHIYGSANNTVDLGGYGYAFRDIYASGTLRIGSTSILDTNSLTIGTATGYDSGKFKIDSNGFMSASSSIFTFGNVTSTGHIYGAANNAVDLGGYGYAFRDIYASGTIWAGIDYGLPGSVLSSRLGGDSLIVGQSNGMMGDYALGRFYLDSSGNLTASGTANYFTNTSAVFGIATSSVGNNAELAVGGDIYATGQIITDSNLTVRGNVTSTGIIYGLNGLISSASSTFSSNVHVNGNVGIGTSTPQAKLHVNGGNLLLSATNPTEKSVVTTTQIDGNQLNGATGVYVSGKYAYVASYGDNSLSIVDISNPASSTAVGYIKDGVGAAQLSGARSVYVSGKYAFVAAQTDNALSIIDISNPASPVEVGFIKDGLGATQLETPKSVFVSGKYAYVSSETDSSLSVIDISNPVTPVEVGTIWDDNELIPGTATQMSNAHSVYVSGRYAYVASHGDSSLTVIDISNPSSPKQVGVIWDDSELAPGTATKMLDAFSVYVSGKYAYVVSPTEKSLSIINISNPASPKEVGTIWDNEDIGGTATYLSYPQSVFIAGKYAYVASGGGSDSLSVIDISNPVSPREAGVIWDNNVLGGTATQLNGAISVFISGKYAYVAANTEHSLSILDISGVDAPSANIGSIESNVLTVSESVDIGNNLSVRNGLNVGMGGILSNGAFAIYTSSTGSNTNIFNIYASSTASVLSIFTVKDNGNIGIGTANPTERLTVSGGNLAVTNNSTTSTLGANFFSIASSTSAMNGIFYVNSAGLVSASSSIYTFGNVTSTGHIYGSVHNAVDLGGYGYAFRNVYTSGTIWAGIDLGLPGAYAVSYLDGNSLMVGKSDTVMGSYNSGLFYIDGSGNMTASGTANYFTNTSAVLGIATSSVGNNAELAVGGDIYATGQIITDSNLTVRGNVTSTGNIYIGAGGFSYISDTATSALRYGATLATTGGLVGIGTSTPSEKLHLHNGDLLITPGNPTLKSTASITNANGVYVFGQYAYVTAGDGLYIMDVSNPASSTQVGYIQDGVGAQYLNGANSVFVSGNYAYVAAPSDNALSIIDISNPASPTEVGFLTDASSLNGARSVYVSGKYAYVASNNSKSVTIIDITDPKNPVQVAVLLDGSNATMLDGIQSIYVSGKYVYAVSNLDNALSVFNVSNPSLPVEVGVISITGPQSVYVSGKYAYIIKGGAGSGISIIDISNPSNLIVVGAVSSAADRLNSIYVAGRYAYASGQDGELFVYNIAEPTSPYEVGEYTTGMAMNAIVFVSGKYAYVVANNKLHIFDIPGIDAPGATIGSINSNNINVSENITIGNNLYIRNGLNIGIGGMMMQGAFGLSVSSSPVTTNIFSVNVSSTASIIKAFNILDNGKVGVGTSTPSEKLHQYGGNFLLSASNPTEKSVIASSTIGAGSLIYSPASVFVSGKYAYVASYDSDSLSIIDISNPASSTAVGYIKDGTGATQLNGANSVYVSGKYAYIASTLDDSLSIIDISNPANPVEIGTIKDAVSATKLDGANSVYVSGKYAYMTSENDNSLTVIDISNPISPLEVGVIWQGSGATRLTAPDAVYISGKYAYVASYTSKSLSIFDISNPASPQEVGTIWDSSEISGLATQLNGAKSVYVSGKYAYVTSIVDHALSIFDISNPASPREVGVIWDSSVIGGQATQLNTANSVYVSGKYAYIASTIDDSLSIIDISNPASPREVGVIWDDEAVTPLGTATQLDGAYSVHVSGKYAYVVGYNDDALSVMDISGIDAPSASIGNIATNDLTVWENADFGNNLSIQGGLNVGMSGIYSAGTIAAYASSSLTGASSTVAGQFIGFASSTPLSVDRGTNDGILISLRRNGTEEGSITVNAGTVSYNAFTGSHYAWSNDTLSLGSLVSLDGVNKGVVNGEIIYGVGTATKANDSKILGSYLSRLNTEGTELIMSVGNGEMWVVDKGENIEAGDYLISSDIAGHAMKDKQEFDVSYIVARAAVPVDWTQVTEEINGVKHKKISVLFDSFVRDNTFIKNFTVDTNSKNFIVGSSSSTLNLNLYGGVIFQGTELNKLSFSASSLFESQLTAQDGDSLFVFNGANATPSSTAVLFSLRVQNQPVFSVAVNGDLRTVGDIYAKSVHLGEENQPGDLAEKVDIAIDDTVEAGDVVVVDQNAPDTYRRSSSAFEQAVAGVVSTNPTIVVGNGRTDYTAVVAMVGRVPVKVSTENGSISRGDLLVSASTTGYAMKYDASKDERIGMIGVIGVALEPLSEGQGKIMTLIRTGWAYNRNQTFATLQQSVVELASAQALSIASSSQDLGVGTNGNELVFTGGNLDLQGGILLNVASIFGKNDKWAIDNDGKFITKVNTSEGKKEMYSMQSPVSEFVFSSSSQLIAGEARINFENIIKEIIDFAVPLKISVTLTSGEAKGIYVSAKDLNGFIVKELQEGNSGATFDWVVVAKRKGGIDEVVPPAPQPDPVPEPPAPNPDPPAPDPQPTPVPNSDPPAPIDNPAPDPAPPVDPPAPAPDPAPVNPEPPAPDPQPAPVPNPDPPAPDPAPPVEPPAPAPN